MNTPAKYSELQPASWRRHRTHSRLSEELLSITSPIVHKLYGNYLNVIATYTGSPASGLLGVFRTVLVCVSGCLR